MQMPHLGGQDKDGDFCSATGVLCLLQGGPVPGSMGVAALQRGHPPSARQHLLQFLVPATLDVCSPTPPPLPSGSHYAFALDNPRHI